MSKKSEPLLQEHLNTKKEKKEKTSCPLERKWLRGLEKRADPVKG